jgi:hypothetical protein
MTESEAKYKANRKLRQDELHKFVWKYEILVQYLLQLWVGKLHSIVKHMVDELSKTEWITRKPYNLL